jgi:hypothetical protein
MILRRAISITRAIDFFWPWNDNEPFQDQTTGEASLKREHPALQNMKFLNFFSILWVIVAFLDTGPDSESGFPDLIESGSNPDPDPQHWQQQT